MGRKVDWAGEHVASSSASAHARNTWWQSNWDLLLAMSLLVGVAALLARGAVVSELADAEALFRFAAPVVEEDGAGAAGVGGSEADEPDDEVCLCFVCVVLVWPRCANIYGA
jgi:hypothetical protein